MGKTHYSKLRSTGASGHRRAYLPLRSTANNREVDVEQSAPNLHTLEANARAGAMEDYHSQGSFNGAGYDGAWGSDGGGDNRSPTPSEPPDRVLSQTSSMATLDVDKYVLELRNLQASRGLNDKQLEAVLKFNKDWHHTADYGLPVSLFTLRSMEQNRSYVLDLDYICPKCNESLGSDLEGNGMRCQNENCNFFGHRFCALNCGYGVCNIKDQFVRLLEGMT